MYKISVILPVYNTGVKLYDAFESILNQSFGFENIEAIFVDDCSSDESPDIIKKFSESYDNVKAICLEENSGFAGKPRNVGIEHASSDYLMFLDPDDVFMENAFEVLYDNITDSGCDMVSANYLKCYNGEEHTTPWDEWYNIKLEDNAIEVKSIFEEPNLFLCPPSIWTKIFKREFILKNNISFPEGVPGQDLVFFQHSLIKSNGIKFVNIPIVRYNAGDTTSVSSNRDKKLLSGYIGAYNESYELLKDYDELIQFSVTHLHYWTIQLALSNLDVLDKIDLLRLAYPLFEIFNNIKSLNPRPRLEKIFERIFNKDFLGAIKLFDRLIFNYEEFGEKLLENVKSSKIFVVFDLKDFSSDIELKRFVDLMNFLDDKGHFIELFNCNFFEIFQENKKNFSDLNSDIGIINIFEYYSIKYANANNAFERNFDSDSINNELVEVKIRNDDFKHVICPDSLKEEIYFKDHLIYSKIYNGVSSFENYYTFEGFEFLKDDLENDRMILFDSNNYFTYLDDFADFQNYFITESAIKSAEKPFLLCTSSIDLKNIKGNIVYNLNDILFEDELYLNDSFDYILNKLEDNFVQCYYEEYKQEFDYISEVEKFPIKINRLENKNKNLQNKNKNLKNKIRQLKNKNDNLNNKINNLNKKLKESRELNNEIMSSKSWKITKPLRVIMKPLK